jgi:hypothetical protein
VDQLSLPYRIGLVALVVVGALWFVVLRPNPGGGTSATPAPKTAPGVTGLTNDVAKAKGAVAKANGATGGAATSTGTSTGSTATPAPKAKSRSDLAADAVTGDPSRSILAAVDHGKVAVVLFWSSTGADDRAVHQALRGVDKHHGKVLTRTVPISQVGKYEAITRGAEVLESPTVFVVGPHGKARAIAGFTHSREINQAVADLAPGF